MLGKISHGFHHKLEGRQKLEIVLKHVIIMGNQSNIKE